MTWSRVQQASAALNGGFSGATATVTPTYGAGTTAGNLLVAFVNWASQFTTYGAAATLSTDYQIVLEILVTSAG